MKIHRAMQLIKKRLGTTHPTNGGQCYCLQDTIIGEGWHKKAGELHAEVNAINSVKDKSLLKATIYVSLEPLQSFGKHRPVLILNHKKMKSVVIRTVDPNVKSSLKRNKKLIEAGIKQTVGVL
jgi:diaminohydroxyphosphoribosylaminopyrimidine deaminase/5-amino-6-(5-phosphoribosylamino)uracil reductase